MNERDLTLQRIYQDVSTLKTFLPYEDMWLEVESLERRLKALEEACKAAGDWSSQDVVGELLGKINRLKGHLLKEAVGVFDIRLDKGRFFPLYATHTEDQLEGDTVLQDVLVDGYIVNGHLSEEAFFKEVAKHYKPVVICSLVQWWGLKDKLTARFLVEDGDCLVPMGE